MTLAQLRAFFFGAINLITAGYLPWGIAVPFGGTFVYETERKVLMSIDSPSAENVSEGTRDADLDQILEDWEFLAAHAYQGFIDHGPGTLIICVSDSTARLAYLSAADYCCEQCTQLLRSYDAQAQAVVAVVKEGKTQKVYVLSGAVTPREAYENATAETWGEVIH
jgi:hypothetical protein